MYWLYTLLCFILTPETWIIRKEALKSVSSSGDKQATPNAIADGQTGMNVLFVNKPK